MADLSGIGSFLRSFAQANPNQQSQMLEQFRQLATAQTQTIQAMTANQQLEAAMSENELARLMAPSRIRLAQAQAKSEEATAAKTTFTVDELKRQSEANRKALANMASAISSMVDDKYKPYFSDPASIDFLSRNPSILSNIISESAAISAGLPQAKATTGLKTTQAEGAQADVTKVTAEEELKQQLYKYETSAKKAVARAEEQKAPLTVTREQKEQAMLDEQLEQAKTKFPYELRALSAEVALSIAKARQMKEGTAGEPLKPSELLKLDELQSNRAIAMRLVQIGAFPTYEQASSYVRSVTPLALETQISKLNSMLAGTNTDDMAAMVLQIFGKAMDQVSPEEMDQAMKELETWRDELQDIYKQMYGRTLKPGTFRAYQRIEGAMSPEDRQRLGERD